jgi:hypothetical protein
MALFWEMDTRIVRRWNVDPKSIPEESVYAVNRNNPIQLNDPLGDCPDCGDDPTKPSPAGILYEAYLGLDAAIFNTLARVVEWKGNAKPGVSIRKVAEYGSDGAVLGNKIVEKSQNSAGREALETVLDLFAAIPGKPNAKTFGLLFAKPVIGKQNTVQVIKQVSKAKPNFEEKTIKEAFNVTDQDYHSF